VADVAPETPATARIASAILPCENCGRETPHRILRVRPAATGPGAVVRGVARCRECRFTHPFESASARTRRVRLIVSTDDVSSRTDIDLPADRRIQVGSGLPDFDPTLRIRRIDASGGRPVPEAHGRDVDTIWMAPVPGSSVALSIILGRETRTRRLPSDPAQQYEVGDEFEVDRIPLRITAIRARGQTWRRPGDRFSAVDVQRLYARRNAIPPAGRSDWRTERERPSSAPSDRSASARSRSGPGVTRKRTAPRARTARSGATVHRSSLS